MNAKCPECDCEFEVGGESNDMDADDMSTSEAVPYEAMTAAPGATLAADMGGEVVQSYATPQQLRARGMRPFAPGGVPEEMGAMRGSPRPIIAVDEAGQETATYATPEQIRARGWTIKGAMDDNNALIRALRSR